MNTKPLPLRAMSLGLIVLFAGCVLLALTAWAPLLEVDWWWVRIGDFPRVQLLLAYLVALGSLLYFWNQPATIWVMGMLAVSVGMQLYWIFPYLPIAPRATEAARSNDPRVRLRLMACNVLQYNRRSELLIQVVRDVRPDVLVVAEVDAWWIEQLAPLEEALPHCVKHPLDNEYGLALYSRLPLDKAEVRFFVRKDIPSIDALLHLPSGAPVRLFAVHPNPPRYNEGTTKRDAELVLVGREVSDCRCTAVVMGDLNDVGWSRTTDLFQEVSRTLDPRHGRGMYPTFNANSWIWRWPLDHLFHTRDLRLVELKVLPHVGSDHFPLLVELSHEPDAAITQESPDLDAGDAKDAEEKLDRARESPESHHQAEIHQLDAAGGGASPDDGKVQPASSFLPTK